VIKLKLEISHFSKNALAVGKSLLRERTRLEIWEISYFFVDIVGNFTLYLQPLLTTESDYTKNA
jgi:hypothetical protein